METQDQKIERILALTEETNKIVRSMRSQHRMSSLFRVVYIAAFVYASWWGYQQMLPYLDQLKATYAQINQLNKTAAETKASISAEAQKYLQTVNTAKPTTK